VPIYVATAGPINAKKTGKFAQGMITVGAADEKVKMLWMACDEGCAEVGKAKVPKLLQLHLSWAPTDEEALQNAMVEWPNGGMPFPKQDIKNPEDFAAMAKLVRPEDFKNRVLITSDLEKHTAHVQHYLDMGFDEVHLHNVGRNQAEFIEVFGREVLPPPARRAGPATSLAARLTPRPDRRARSRQCASGSRKPGPSALIGRAE
jgi:alkanesulfonate monooxygenase SsuD/methylene tetrahydromethanopterin reductase-like flavin-dependent oxidoreductase (luciferase family)